MRKVQLSANVNVSRLGFGCAPVMGRVGRRQALRAMACALELGVSHFDIARSYGFGDAESVLGEFLRGRRHQVTVTTKFGVVPPRLSRVQRGARALIRPFRTALSSLRPTLRNYSSGLLSERRFDVAYGRQCLETSLRQMGTDYVDCYLLHEPDLSALRNVEDLMEFFERSVRSGRIRTWGLAHAGRGESFPTGDVLGRVIQFEARLRREMPPTSPAMDNRFVFVTRPLAGSLENARWEVSGLQEKLGLDTLQCSFAVACATAGSHGAVIAGMFTEEHIRQNTLAVDYYDENRSQIDNLLVNC